MKRFTPLAVAAVALAWAGCNTPAVASPPTGTHLARVVADPNDVACATEGGTRIWCKHTLGADTGNVIVSMENYANCFDTEDSCHFEWVRPVSGAHAGDGFFLLTGGPG